MARRSDEAQAEALEIVEGVAERVDLEFAAVARARVDMADRQAAAEAGGRRVLDLLGERDEFGIVGVGARFP